MEENNDYSRELEQVKEDPLRPLDLGKLVVIESDPDAMYGYQEVYWLANQRFVTGSVYADIAHYLRRKDSLNFVSSLTSAVSIFEKRLIPRAVF